MMQDARFMIQDAGCKIQDAGYWMLDDWMPVWVDAFS